MDINVTGRHTTITDRFREYSTDKVAKVGQLLPRAQTVTVKLTQQQNGAAARGAGARVEITVHGPGGVIRAEAEGAEKYRAFDQAFHKVMERARRLHDKRSDHRGRTSVHDAAAVVAATPGLNVADNETIEAVAAAENGTAAEPVADEVPADDDDWSPVVIREKRFPAVALTSREAIDQMELVGHPFYLFMNSETGEANVVYRRKGWSYGVISLGENADQQ